MKWILYVLLALTVLAMAAFEIAVLVTPEIPRGQGGFQEPQRIVEGPPPEGEQGPRARILSLGEGPRDMVGAMLMRDESGLMSVSRVPAEAFAFFVGKARVSAPFRGIRKIEVDEDRVRVTGVDGCVMEGTADDKANYSIAGFTKDLKADVPMRDVRSVEFRHSPPKEPVCGSCGRVVGGPEWRYCPYDGKRLGSAIPPKSREKQ
jgi:hypothetical protein